MHRRRQVITIVGTTGVGKSKLSIELAQKVNGEIINADSMQMYRDIPIITNKHPVDERFGVPHHVMNHVDWSEEYFNHRFEKEANEKIEDIYSRGKIPIIIGGTNYYVQSLLFNNKTIGTSSDTEGNIKLSQEEQNILDGPGDILFQELYNNDPVVAHKFHPNDTRRVRRALEIFYQTKKKTSDIYKEQKIEHTTGSSLRYNTLVLWIWSDLEILDKRLDSRVDDMISSGALGEIKELYEYYKSFETEPDCERGVWQVIGFKEFLPWLKNENEKSLFEDGLDQMKMRTRKYARRQTKWIKNTLSPELYKESSHDFINGGKVFLLDATDLSKWDENISVRGSNISENFISDTESNLPTPLGLEKLLPDFTGLNPTDDNKKSTQEEKWEHFKCSVCKTPENEDLILVGLEQWNIHLKSRRHNSMLNKGKRKREYEEWLARKQNEDKQDQTSKVDRKENNPRSV